MADIRKVKFHRILILISEINENTKFIAECKFEERNPMVNHIAHQREERLKKLTELKIDFEKIKKYPHEIS